MLKNIQILTYLTLEYKVTTNRSKEYFLRKSPLEKISCNKPFEEWNPCLTVHLLAESSAVKGSSVATSRLSSLLLWMYFLKKHCRGTKPAGLEGIQRCCPTPHIAESSVMDSDLKLVVGSGSEKKHFGSGQSLNTVYDGQKVHEYTCSECWVKCEK